MTYIRKEKTMANKITKRDNFNAIIEVLNSANRPDLASVMIHEIELLDKKNANRSDKPTAAQKENVKIKEKLLSAMTLNQWYRCSEIKALVPALENSSGTQRIAVICRRLEEAGILSKTVDKRVIYYSLTD